MTTAPFDPGPLARTECIAADERWTLVFVRDLRHPREAVWASLTDPKQLAEWSPFTADRDLGAPGDVVLRMIDGEDGEAEEQPGEVTAADPPALLEYTWGGDVLRWELEPAGAGTTLTLRHTVKDRDMIPKVAAGWHLCLVVAEKLLAGTPIGPIVGAAAMDYGWQDLHDAYAAQLGLDPTE
jgi:uncharacterized protein YndB with AHSA1/START domain